MSFPLTQAGTDTVFFGWSVRLGNGMSITLETLSFVLQQHFVSSPDTSLTLWYTQGNLGSSPWPPRVINSGVEVASFSLCRGLVPMFVNCNITACTSPHSKLLGKLQNETWKIKSYLKTNKVIEIFTVYMWNPLNLKIFKSIIQHLINEPCTLKPINTSNSALWKKSILPQPYKQRTYNNW